MITVGDVAQNHFRKLLVAQGPDILGIRLRAVKPGTPKADCQLEFCEEADLLGNEWIVECDGFRLYVEADSVPYLDNAAIDLQETGAGSQLTVKAPKLRSIEPGADASLVERVRYLLEAEINPSLAAHKGNVRLEEVTSDGVVVLRFGGGCQGCGMVDVTLRDGIERTLRTRIPEITAVRDATDHTTGDAPYM